MASASSLPHHDGQSEHPWLRRLTMALAAIVGMGIGMSYVRRHLPESEVAEKARDLAHRLRLTGHELKNTLKDIWGEASSDLEENYIEMRSRILAMVDYLQEGAELTREKFQDIVDETIDRYSRGKHWSKKIIGKLSDHLESLWDDLKK